MQIRGIGQNGYASTYYQLMQKSTNSSTGSSTQSTSSGYVTTSDLQALAQLASQAMDSMGIAANGRVTFNQITAYRNQEEAKYSEKLQKDLEALGVDKDISFQLSVDSAGKMVVNTDHEDKSVIEKYFNDNPEMVSKYNELQALNNLEAARKSMQISPSEMRKRIQVESMASWWADSGNESTSIANFYAGSMAMYSGINTTV